VPSRSHRGSAYKGSACWGAATGGRDRGLTLQRGRTALRGSTAGPGDRICIYRYAESSMECLSPCAAPSIPAARGPHLRQGSRRCLGEHGADSTLHSCRNHLPRALRLVRENEGPGAHLEGRASSTEAYAEASEQHTHGACRLHWGQQAAQGAIRPAATGSRSAAAICCQAASCAGGTRRLAVGHN